MMKTRNTEDWIELIETIVSVAIQVSIFSVAISALMTGKWLTAFSGFTLLALSFAPALLERRLRVRLPIELTFFVCLFLFASFVLGEVRDFYEQVWWWDLLLHGFAALVTGLIGFLGVYVFYVTNRIKVSPITIAVISFGCAVTIGTLWEIFEYAMDLSFGLNMQRSGLTDTMTDLIVNAVGALVAALIAYYYVRRGGELMGRRLIQGLVARRRID